MTFRPLFILVVAAILVLFSEVAALAAHSEIEAQEYKLKAAFLLNFSKFTLWPKESFFEATQTFDVCVVGEDPFGTALDGLELKKVDGRQVRLHYAASIAAAQTCHIMFISKSEHGHLAQLQQLTERPVLTVSDIEDFSLQGGIFELITQDGRLSFIANNSQAIHGGLRINASLLNLAVKVF